MYQLILSRISPSQLPFSNPPLVYFSTLGFFSLSVQLFFKDTFESDRMWKYGITVGIDVPDIAYSRFNTKNIQRNSIAVENFKKFSLSK